jgi:membrane protein DedA with SNARE-associated domain/rhodanese-related sulfurtransferase
MTGTSEFLVKHGAPVLLAAVFVEQMGLPLPSLPWMLAAGALAATGQFNLALGIFIVVIACVVADVFWFYLGRYRGRQVMGFLCRITIEPDSCVRRTENMFTRYGMWGVLAAKFVPGLNTMAPPLAGMSGVNAGRFAATDAIGSLIYGSCFLGLGFLFKNEIEKIAAAIASIGGSALMLVLGLVALYLGYKYFRRRLVLRELRMARITVAELREKQSAGENLMILDLRSSAEFKRDPALILGAKHLVISDVEKRHEEIPRDCEVIVYCSCPNEVTAARAALLLRRKGITRVRPLLGGIDAWRKNDFPLEKISTAPKAPGSVLLSNQITNLGS